jgi:ABC-type branched-subunit amino acid transport system substrate-binding protein
VLPAVLIAGACSSSSSSSKVAGSSGAGPTSTAQASRSALAGQVTAPTYTIGVLTDLTGLGASSERTTVQGVEAGVYQAGQQGYRFKYVVADTTSLPGGALTAAQKLVDEDHVFAVVASSGLTFAASNYLASRGIPVVGAAQDGPEWLSSTTMFSVFGRSDATKVGTTFGQFMKSQGVTNVGSVGYSIAPLSADAAKSEALSAEAAGLKAGYVDPSFAFGSTNVQPVALAMKAAGVDGITASVEPNTAFALVTALRQLGVKLKVALLPTGYGGDLTQGGKDAIQSAQGIYFYVPFEPVEMGTPATRRFQDALKAVGVPGDPTYAEYIGYTSVDMIVRGLRQAGANPTQAGFIAALDGVHDYDAAGLLGSHTVDLGSMARNVFGPDNCVYVTKLAGSTFQLVPGADPICGSVVPGKSVSP